MSAFQAGTSFSFVSAMAGNTTNKPMTRVSESTARNFQETLMTTIGYLTDPCTSSTDDPVRIHLVKLEANFSKVTGRFSELPKARPTSDGVLFDPSAGYIIHETSLSLFCQN
jgi:hypothetical protein